MPIRDDKMTRTCLTCGKEFRLARTYYIEKRPVRHCSKICAMKKNPINQNYFKQPLTQDKLITLGQMVATAYIQDRVTIVVKSDQSTIDDIQTKLNCTYPVSKSDNGKLKVKISSIEMVEDLRELGIVHNPLFQEYLPYDILEGLLKTDCYKKVDGVQTFRTPSSKLALELAYVVNGYIITETYKDVFKGVLGCDWVVIW